MQSGETGLPRDVRSIIHDIYALAAELEAICPGRHFTPDGHMVGSIGEVIVGREYDLKLFEASHPVHDAVSFSDGRLVQIKATQGERIAISACPDFLIVIKIYKDGTFEEVYNGPGAAAWDACGRMQKNGQRQISVAKLKGLSALVKGEDGIARRAAL